MFLEEVRAKNSLKNPGVFRSLEIDVARKLQKSEDIRTFNILPLVNNTCRVFQNVVFIGDCTNGVFVAKTCYPFNEYLRKFFRGRV